ncbi:MAG: right-handed parallel beta-helix repeat-containing protein [Nitrococcus sp.]|nr:right-handed parallel beta-helix repeat-containing protein [Nitrococcus sp.]
MTRSCYGFVRIFPLLLIVACGVCHGEVPCNLQQRIDQASPGGIIDGAGCVERSAVTLRKRLTLKNLTIKGSDNWSGDFTAAGGNYRSSRTVPGLEEPSTTDDSDNRTLCEAPNDVMCREAEMVFVNGTYLSQVPNGSDPGPGEFAMDSQRRVVLGSNPGNALVEVVVRQVGLRLGSRSAATVLDHVAVTQVGNTVGSRGPGTGPAVKNNGRQLTVKNSEVSWVHGSAIACGGGVSCEITGTDVHHAGAAGVITNKSPLVFDHNRIHHNCSSLPDVHYNTTFSCSGIKVHGTSTGRRSLTNSEFYNNDHAGVWLDGGANHVLIANNRIHHNDEQGIHIEIASDVTIRDNVLYENGWVGTPSTALNSSAIYVHDSGNVEISGNVMAWNRDGFAYIGGGRRAQNTGIEVYDNAIIAGATDPGKQLLTAWLLLGDTLGGNIAHGNRYYYGGEQDSTAKKKFQWERNQYSGLATFNSTPGEQSSFWLTGGEVNSILSANNIPRGSH